MEPEPRKPAPPPEPNTSKEDLQQEQPEFIAQFLEENCDCTTRAFSVIGKLSEAIKARTAGDAKTPDAS